jgi:hypothetical protein
MPAATEPLADVGISSNVKSAGDNAGVSSALRCLEMAAGESVNGPSLHRLFRKDKLPKQR